MAAKNDEPTAESDLAEYFSDGPTDLPRDPDDIARRLTQARENAGLSGSELADLVGVTATTVSSWELGDRAPRAHHLTKICGVLGIGFTWLVVGRGSEPGGSIGDVDAVRADLASVRSRLDDVVNELAVLDQRLAHLSEV